MLLVLRHRDLNCFFGVAACRNERALVMDTEGFITAVRASSGQDVHDMVERLQLGRCYLISEFFTAPVNKMFNCTGREFC